VPAVGGSTVVGFFGHPESNATPATKKAIDTIRFIVLSSKTFLTLNPSLPGAAVL
jgi:hypothetical protein